MVVSSYQNSGFKAMLEAEIYFELQKFLELSLSSKIAARSCRETSKLQLPTSVHNAGSGWNLELEFEHSWNTKGPRGATPSRRLRVLRANVVL